MAAALALVTAACASGGTATRRAEVRTQAPLFTTYDLDGKKVALKDFRGSRVVSNFWASRCVPCRKEFPLLAQAEALDRVKVLGVVFNHSVANARKFMAEHGGTWPGLKDDGRIAKAYRVGPGIPATIVINPRGVVVVRHIGEIRSLADLQPGGIGAAPTTTTTTSTTTTTTAEASLSS